MSFQNWLGVLSRLCHKKLQKTPSHYKCLLWEHITLCRGQHVACELLVAQLRGGVDEVYGTALVMAALKY